MKVHVTWFKQNGTYYTDHEYETEIDSPFDVLDSFKSGLSNGYRPGLTFNQGNDLHAVLNIFSAPGYYTTYLILAEKKE